MWWTWSESYSISLIFKRFLVGTAASLLTCSALANPVPGNIAAGQVSIQQTPTTTTVDQTSQHAIINWQSFNIGAGESTHFQQPTGGVALNRINPSQGASQIYGMLTATGQIILVNPAGLYFGPSAYVNVGGMIATTANISNQNFLNGTYQFANVGSYSGAVVNDGQIIAANNGLVALVAPGVVNNGMIQANLGHVVLASGEAFTLNFSGDDLINFAITSKTTTPGLDKNGNALPNGVSNTGSLFADGGQVLITAQVAAGVLNTVINMQGVVQAKSVYQQNGDIIISGDPDAGVVNVAANLDASGLGAGQTGGDVSITGYNILLNSPTLINVSGDAGGGHIDIGGNTSSLPLSNSTVILPGATLLANAVNSGNGGLIETSGDYLQVNGINVSTTAPNGQIGTWLLDPSDIYIADNQTDATNAGMTSTDTTASTGSGSNPTTFAATDATPDSLLTTGNLGTALGSTNVVVTTTNASGTGVGNINVVDPIAWASTNSLTLNAANNINLLANGSITTGAAGSALILNAGGNVTQTGSGIIGGSGGVTIQSGAVNYTLANTYSGATTLNGGSLTMSGADGSAQDTDFTVNTGATLTLDDTSAINTAGRIGAASSITLQGGEFVVNGSDVASTNVNEIVGALLLPSNASTVTINSGSGGSTALTFASITRSAGATILFRGTNLGANPGAGNTNIFFTDPTGLNLTGGGGAAGSTDINIVPYAIGDTSASGSGIGFVTYDVDSNSNSNGIRPLNTSTEYVLDSLTAGNNVELTTGTTTAPASLSINSLLLNGGTLNFGTNTRTETITSGALAYISGGGITSTNVASRAIGFGTTEAIIQAINSFTIESNLTGSGGLTESGAGTLTLNTQVKALTGTYTINSGTLADGIANTIATTNTLLIQNAGTFDLSGFAQTIASLQGSGTVTDSGAAATLTDAETGTNTFSGDITGALALTKSGAGGTLTLSGINSYTGATTISAGTLSLGSTTALSTASTATVSTAGATLDIGFSNGTLANSNSITIRGTGVGALGALTLTGSNDTLTNPVVLATTGTSIGGAGSGNTLSGGVTGAALGLILTGTGSNTESGVIGTTTGTMTVSGTGTWMLTAANTYTGATTLDSGGLTLTGLGTTAATAAAFTVDLGATLTLDNTATNIPNRISDTSATLTLDGGQFVLNGSNVADSNAAQTLGALTLPAGFTSTITLNAGSGGSTILTFASATQTAGASVLFRGTNLGSTAGAGNTNILFTSATGLHLTGGGGAAGSTDINIVPYAIGDISATGTGIGFVTYDVDGDGDVDGIRPLNLATEYTTATTSGKNNLLVNASIAGPASAATYNSILIDNGSTFTIGSGETYTDTSGAIFSTTGANTIGVNGTLAFSTARAVITALNGGNLAITSAITGSAGMTTAGAGVLSLQTNSISAGTLSVTAGELMLDTTTSLGSMTTPTVANGAELNIAFSNGTLGDTAAISLNGTGISNSGALSFSGSNDILSNNLTLTGATTIGGAGSNITLNGTIGGAQALTISNLGSVTLGGVISALTGLTSNVLTTINANVSTAGAQTYNSDVTIGNSLTLSATGTSGSINLPDVALGGNTLTISNAAASTISGSITGTGGLTKSTGTGILTLSGSNTYSGATTVNAGTLSINNVAGLGTDIINGTSGIVVATGGTLDFSFSNGTLDNTNGISLGTTAAGALTFTGTNDILSNNITLTAASTIGGAGSGTLNGSISGAFGLTKAGASTITLGGNNSYTTTTVSTGGTLNVGTINSLGSDVITVSSGGALNIGFSNGTLTDTSTLSLAGTGIGATGALTFTGINDTLSNAITMTAASTIGGTGSGILSGNIGNSGTASALTKAGTGTITLLGNNSSGYTTTTINAGTLSLGSITALGSSTTSVSAGAALDIDFNNSTLTNTSAITINGTGPDTTGALTFTGTNNILNNAIAMGAASAIGGTGSATLNGVISGAFNLTMNDTNTITLGASNSYSGGTTLNAGILSVSANGNLGNAAGALTFNGGTIRITSINFDSSRAITLNAGGGIFDAFGQGWTTSGTTAAFSGNITGVGALTLDDSTGGPSVIVFSGNNSYSGGTIIQSGTFGVGSNTAIAPGTITFPAGGLNAGIRAAASARVISNNIILDNDITLGRLTTLSGTITLGNNVTIYGDNPDGIANSNSTISGNIGDGGNGYGITIANGPTYGLGTAAIVFSGNNTYTGATNVNSGTLSISNANGLGTSNVTGTSGINVASGGTLDINFVGTLANNNLITLAGTGIDNNGALTFSSSNATLKNNITMSAATSLGGTGTGTISGNITDPYSLVSNANMITLSGNNSLTGTTSIMAGTLNLASSTALTGSSDITVASGAALELTNINLNDIPLSLAGALYGSGTSGWNGNITLTDDSTIGTESRGDIFTLNGTINGTTNETQSLTLTGPGTIQLASTIGDTVPLYGLFSQATLVTSTAAVNAYTFDLTNGTWSQISNPLPAFNVTDFQINSGDGESDGIAFIRALSGDGSSGNPYMLADIYGIQGITSSYATLTLNYKLANNIDASSTANWNGGLGFIPIGALDGFFGSFNGAGFVINGLTINQSSFSGYVVGLFGTNFGSISNVYSTGSVTVGDDSTFVGSLIGDNEGSITNSSSAASVTTGAYSSFIGGLVGYNEGNLANSFSTGSVIVGADSTQIGGLAGYNNSPITNSYSMGSVTTGASSADVGGLVGQNDGGSITNAYSTAAVTAGTGSDSIGGLVGYNDAGATITNTYSTGLVTPGTGSTNNGGLVGYDDGTNTTSNSFWDTQTSGQNTSAAGTGLTTAEMQTLSTFSDAGWDITATPSTTAIAPPFTWFIFTGTTPLLLSTQNTNITTAQQLQLMGATLGGNYTVINNIDLSGLSSFLPVGSSSAPFSGSLNGNGYTITNLVIDSSGNYLGLFGYTSNTASISNVSVSGTITGGVTSQYVGGLIGYNNGSVATSYSTVNVSGNSDVGGLIGYNNSGATTIHDLYSIGNVTGLGTSSTNLGGLIGFNAGNVSNTYSTGVVTGDVDIGGLIGNQSSGTLTSNYFDTNTSDIGSAQGCGNSSNCIGVTGATTAALLNPSTYSDWNIGTNLSTDTWVILTGQTRPMLAMEYNTAISNAHQLQLAALDPSAAYTLSNNIDLSGTTQMTDVWGTSNSSGSGFSPIGTSSVPFTGSFNGNNYIISNLYINLPDSTDVGLFGYTSGSTIENVGLTNVQVTGGTAVGGLVGNLSTGSTVSNTYSNGNVTGTSMVGGLIGYTSTTLNPLAGNTISNSYSSGTVTGSGDEVGGLIGYVSGDSSDSALADAIISSYSISTISGADYVGGLVGYLTNYSTIDSSYSTGNISGADYVGGLVGANAGTAGLAVGGQITNSYSSGNVSGTNQVGGFIGNAGSGDNISNSYSVSDVTGTTNVGGFAGSATSTTISDSYSSGLVTGTTTVGGFIGQNTESDASSSVWDTQTSGQATSNGGTGYTTAQLMTESTYSGLGWNIGTNPTNNTWLIFNGLSRPMLAMEYSTTITTAHQLQLIGINATTLAAATILAGNIDASGTYNPSDVWGTSMTSGLGFIPLGNSSSFTGVFDGENYTISNLYINNPSATSSQGLFSSNSGISIIENLNVTNLSVVANNNVGGLIGNNTGTISNVIVAGNVSGNNDVGGLIGTNTGSVSNDSFTGNVDGTDTVGGLIGYNHTNGSLSDVYSGGSVAGNNTVGGLIGQNDASIDGSNHSIYTTASVSGFIIDDLTPTLIGGLMGGNSSDVSNISLISPINVNSNGIFLSGGFVGFNSGTLTNIYVNADVVGSGVRTGGIAGINAGIINNSYVTGFVGGSDHTGGLVGEMDNGGSINNSYNMATVSAPTNIAAGLVGFLDDGTITNSYSTGRIIASQPAGLVGEGYDLTMTNSYWDEQTAGTSSGPGTALTTAQMMTQSNFSGWDFSSTWGIIPGQSYPYLLSFYPSTPRAISGLTAATGGTTINLAVNGSVADTTTTGANGFYYFLTGDNVISGVNNSIANGSDLLAYLDSGTTTGNAVTIAPASNGSITGLSMAASTLDIGDANTNNLSIADLAAAMNGLVDTNILYSVSDNNLTLGNAANLTTNLNTTATTTFTIDGTISSTSSGSGNLAFNGATDLAADLVLNRGSNNITFNTIDSVDSTPYALTLNTAGTVTLGGIIGGTNKLSTLTVTASGAANDLTIANNINTTSDIDLIAGLNVTLSSGSLNSSGGNVSLTGTTGVVKETGAGAITGALLTTNSVGGQTLNASNTVTSFNASNVGGAISLINTAPLSIADITQSGVGNVSVNNTGNINVTGSIAAGSNNISLTSNGNITESGSGLVSGLLLTLQSASGATLNGTNGLTGFNATNSGTGNINLTNTASLLTITGISQNSGTVGVTNTGALTTTGLISANGGNVTLSTLSPDSNERLLTVNGNISTNGGNISLSAANNASGSADALIVNNTLNTSPGSGGVLTLSGGLALNASPVVGSGNITLQGNGNDLTLGTLSFGTSTSFQVNDTITVDGALSSTTGSNLTLQGDVNDTGLGGVNITSTGSINSGGSLTLIGSNLSGTPGDAGIQIASGATINAVGNINMTIASAGTGVIETGTNISSSSGSLNFNSAVALTSGVTLTGTTVNLTNGVSGNQNLTINGNNINLGGTLALNNISLTGTGSNNSLVLALSSPETWTISSANGGSIANISGVSGATTFTNIQNLTGGSGNNTFVIANGANISGTLSGGSLSATNLLNLSNYAAALTVALSGTNAGTVSSNSLLANFTNMTNLSLNSQYNNVIALPSGKQNTINITGGYQGYINDPIYFTGVGSFTGGSNNVVIFGVPATYNPLTGMVTIGGVQMFFPANFSFTGSVTTTITGNAGAAVASVVQQPPTNANNNSSAAPTITPTWITVGTTATQNVSDLTTQASITFSDDLKKVKINPYCYAAQ